jgi:hypothetical protein
VVKISAQSEHFSVLVLKVSHSKFWLFKPIFRHLGPNTDPDPGQIECGSNRIRIRNTGSGSRSRNFSLQAPAPAKSCGSSSGSTTLLSFRRFHGRLLIAEIRVLGCETSVSLGTISFSLGFISSYTPLPTVHTYLPTYLHS